MKTKIFDYDDPRHIFNVTKTSLNTAQIQKDDVDVLKFKIRCDYSNTKKLTALKISPQLCVVTLILIPN